MTLSEFLVAVAATLAWPVVVTELAAGPRIRHCIREATRDLVFDLAWRRQARRVRVALAQASTEVPRDPHAYR